MNLKPGQWHEFIHKGVVCRVTRRHRLCMLTGQVIYYGSARLRFGRLVVVCEETFQREHIYDFDAAVREAVACAEELAPLAARKERGA